MRYLSQIMFFFFSLISIQAAVKSPHGENFNFACELCHSSSDWSFKKNSVFDHGVTAFPLTGIHKTVDCRDCHKSLRFSDAGTQCISCHSHIHKNTLDQSCEICHTTQSFIISNVTLLHQASRFPLLGAHANAECADCHKNASLMQFEPLGAECYDCHKEDYLMTQYPNHIDAGFATTCNECHAENKYGWATQSFDHSFFPLTQGHDIEDCTQCHISGNYSSTSSECYSCHVSDFRNTTNPSHTATGFSNLCENCHTTAPGWQSASFREHDNLYFPVYSGSHNGTWVSCSSCHLNSSSYSDFSCTVCHEHNRTDMDREHLAVDGYSYNDASCLACHPNGENDGGFNHDLTAFPLTGAHRETLCVDCHSTGYAGTNTDCNGCHNNDYLQAADPSHSDLGLSTECSDCHTTNPGWTPASFAVHDEYYVLRGAHAAIATECIECHSSGYMNTPSDCNSCHAPDYEATTNPSHTSLNLSRECNECHNENVWTGATFAVHDNYYPLKGAHAVVATECKLCHTTGYKNTPSDCVGCHKADYDKTTNPAHASAAFPTDCEECHNVNSWTPSTFNHDAQYFPIYSGKHRSTWAKCSECHPVASSFAQFTCTSCHEHNKSSMDSAHRGERNYVYNSSNCFACHPRGRAD